MSDLEDHVAREVMELELYPNFHGRGECWVSANKELVIARWRWEPEKSWKQIGMVVDKMREHGFKWLVTETSGISHRFMRADPPDGGIGYHASDHKIACCEAALAAKRAERDRS